MCLNLEGYTLTVDSYYKIPAEYNQLPVRQPKHNITSWEWYQETHGNTITTFLQASNTISGVKPTGGAIGMSIPKGGNNWPIERLVSIADIEIRRVHYYTIIHDLNENWERYAKLVLNQVDDIAFYRFSTIKK